LGQEKNLNECPKCHGKTEFIKVIFSREVREPYKDSNGRNRFSSSYEDMEFMFTKEYSKMFSPVFSGNYDFDAKEENGIITVILTPASKENTATKAVESKRLLATQDT
jgi:hypothetical protein